MDWNYVAAYTVVSIVGLVVALIELLSRYGAGNRPSWVLMGKPQTVYYVTNICAAILVLFISEMTEKSNVIALFATTPGVATLEAAKIGIISMFALRSSLYSVERRDKNLKVDFGPAQILTVINRYLERQMDQNRGHLALKEVAGIFDDFEPDLMELTSICLNVPESISGEEMVRLRKEVDLLQKEKSVSSRVRAINMGVQIQREVGADTLRAAVKILKKRAESAVPTTTTGPSQSAANSQQSPTTAPVTVTQQSSGVLSLEELNQELDVQLGALSSEQELPESTPRG